MPVVKSSSVAGYRKGMKVEATGEDITHGTGNAGGYVGLAVGGQIWGDLDQNGQKLVEGVTAAGANVSNLRKVEGRNNVGGFIGVPLPVRLRMWTPMRPRDSCKESSTRWYRTRQVWSAYCRPRLRRFAVHM